MDLPKLSDFKHVFRSTFTDLSGWKKGLMRIALGLLALGGVLYGVGLARGAGEGGIDWSGLCLRSGAGYIGGFLVGAIVRLYLKLALLVGVALAALGFVLSKVGLVELPWDSFSEIAAAFAEAAERQTSALKEFLSGYLPAGGTGGVGLVSGVTQKPSFDDDRD